MSAATELFGIIISIIGIIAVICWLDWIIEAIPEALGNEAPGGKSLERRGSGRDKAERLGDTHSHNSRPVSDPEQGHL